MTRTPVILQPTPRQLRTLVSALTGAVGTSPGTTFLRVDVPEHARTQAYTRIFGAGAIYGITPCTEEQARAVLERGWGFTHPEFAAKQLPAPVQAGVEDAELEDDDDSRY